MVACAPAAWTRAASRATILHPCLDPPTRGASVSEREPKSIRLRRLPALLTALSIAAAGLAWGGCGGGGETTGSEAQERIEKGAEEARKGLEKGKEEVEKGFEKGQKEAERHIEKGRAEAERGLQQGKSEAKKAIEEAEEQVQESTP